MAGCAAATDTGVLTNALALVDCYTASFVFDAYGRLFGPGTRFAAVLTSTLVLYVAIYGIQLALGTARLTLDQFGPRVLKIGFIVGLLGAWPTFQRLVVDVAFGAPMGIAAEMLALLDESVDTPAGVLAAIDAFYDRMLDAASNLIKRASITELRYYVAAGFVWLVTVVAMLFAFGFLLISKLATALILGVGPLFIALYLFGGTRGLFEGWLRALVGFALVPMFLLTSLAMLLAMIDGTVATVEAEAAIGRMTWDNLVLLLVITAGFALLFIQIPNVTAAIAGGISIAGAAGAMAAIGSSLIQRSAAGVLGTIDSTGGAASLAWHLGSPKTRARTVLELQAARRRVTAGLGESARWWTRVATTPAMRHYDRKKILRKAAEPPELPDPGSAK